MNTRNTKKKQLNPIIAIIALIVVIVVIILVYTASGNKGKYKMSKTQAEGYQNLIDKGYMAPAPVAELKKMGVKLPEDYGQADKGWKIPPYNQNQLRELMELPPIEQNSNTKDEQ